MSTRARNVVIVSVVSVSSNPRSWSHCRHSCCAFCASVSAASCSRTTTSTRCLCNFSRREASSTRVLAEFQASTALRAAFRRASAESNAAASGCLSRPSAAAESSSDWRAVSVAISASAVCRSSAAATGEGAGDDVGVPINQSTIAAVSRTSPPTMPKIVAPPPTSEPATIRATPASPIRASSAMLGRTVIPDSVSRPAANALS